MSDPVLSVVVPLFNEQEVVRDITTSFDALRVINPDLRFLLTVSPVPLTATASGQHVLTATTYSKSVLRSAAGFLSQNRDTPIISHRMN